MSDSEKSPSGVTSETGVVVAAPTAASVAAAPGAPADAAPPAVPVAAPTGAALSAVQPAADYKFDPGKTRVIVLTWPDAAMTVEAMRWIWTHWKNHPQNIIAHCQKAPVDVVRCKAVEMYCLKAPPEIEQFIFMDRDMRPGQDSNPVLVTPGDVAACQYPTPRLCDWSDPRALHMGLVRFSRKVIETLAA